MLRVLSLGAGVQSTTLALMAARGEIGPMPDCAIFANTGDEKRGTYRYLNWLTDQLPFPVIRVRRFAESLSQYTLGVYAGEIDGNSFSPPFYFPGGMLPKRCSKEFKTRAIITEIRKMMGLKSRQRGPRSVAVEQWIGISQDEADRMKPSEVSWIANRWPLIEKRMRRSDCVVWLSRNLYPLPPRSACVYCPFQSDEEFDDMRQNTADDDFARAVLFDQGIRAGGAGTYGPLYVHGSCRPLGEVEFDRQSKLTLWPNECDGVCGT